jgi:tyrosyl-tRNA synthetase
MTSMHPFMETLQSRGYIHQTTDSVGLNDMLRNGIISGYVGFDATADSLHVGNLVSIMMLRHLQMAGHQPIVLIGGGTTKIGDPSGKDESRRMLTDEQIANNITGIKEIFQKFLRFDDSPTSAIIVNNDEWLSDLSYIPFLREVGQHFTINRMLTMDSVKTRLERKQPLTFLEFNYMILQGYDFVELNKRYGCILQMGGSDQWGNIVQGVELGRRLGDRSLYGMTTPLITTASGSKMGKSVSGAIWLRSEKLSVYDYWQFWRNTDDADVSRFLRLFTDLPLSEIEKLDQHSGSDINEAKITLANEATALCHGREASIIASQAASVVFNGGVSSDLPSIVLSNETSIVDVMMLLHMVQSRSDAKRMIIQGGVKINDQTITDVNHKIQQPLDQGDCVTVTCGKKKHGLVKFEK